MPATEAQSSRDYDTGDIAILFASYRAQRPDSGEANLRRAMLEQAWLDWWSRSFVNVTRLERMKLRAWLFGVYRNGVPYRAEKGFSFEEVCDCLGLHVEATRKAILNTAPPSVRIVRDGVRGNRIQHLRKRDRRRNKPGRPVSDAA